MQQQLFYTFQIFEPDNPKDLMRALLQTYSERAHWLEMGGHGRDVIVARHSWEARVHTMIGQIEEILERKYGTAYPVGRRG